MITRINTINRTFNLWFLTRNVLSIYKFRFREFCIFSQESQDESPGGAVSLFGQDQIGLTFAFGILIVLFFAVEKHDDIRVLLDGTAFFEVG